MHSTVRLGGIASMLSLSVEAWYQVVYTAISRGRVGEGNGWKRPAGLPSYFDLWNIQRQAEAQTVCRVEVFSLGVVDSGRPRPRMYTAVDTYVETSNEGTFKFCGR